MNPYSDWCEMVEETQPWSSPAIISTPPFGELPYMLPCLMASPDLSTPGPLPYQSPKTPSTVVDGCCSACCAPAMMVAAISSFTAGRKSILWPSRCRLARHSSTSKVASGEPR